MAKEKTRKYCVGYCKGYSTSTQWITCAICKKNIGLDCCGHHGCNSCGIVLCMKHQDKCYCLTQENISLSK